MPSLFMHVKTFEMLEYVKPSAHNYVPIDAEIAPTVQLLNRKGYITMTCCAGHHPGDEMLKRYVSLSGILFTSSSYISLYWGILLPSLPPGFLSDVMVMDDKTAEISEKDLKDLVLLLAEKPELQKKISIVIKHDWDLIDSNTFRRKHIELMEQLYEWALNLPDFKSE